MTKCEKLDTRNEIRANDFSSIICAAYGGMDSRRSKVYKITIPLYKLVSGMTLADPIQITNQFGESVLTLPRSYVVTEKAILTLKRMSNYSSSTVAIYSSVPSIPDASAMPVPLVIEQEAKSIVESPAISEKTRDIAVDSIKKLFTSAESDANGTGNNNMTTAFQIVTNLDLILDELVETVTANPKGLVQIAGLKSYDEYTYHHSLSVSVLSVAIGQAMKLNQREIKRLGRSAMLHDIGKMMIPHKYISKPAKLSPHEFANVKRHPEIGARYLKYELIGNEELWDSVKYHHEKVNGSGYPKGLKDKEIPLFSKIISVSDVYDALTSFRPYRDPMRPPADAVELLMSEAGSALDLEVIQAFVRRIELYPVGSTVQLSDKRYGRVLSNINPMRPSIKMLESEEIIDLATLGNLHLVIVWSEAAA